MTKMKRFYLYIIGVFAISLSLSSCVDLDVDPLSDASSGTWFSTENELRLAANDFYKIGYWNAFEGDIGHLKMSDDYSYRAANNWNPFLDGTLTTQTGIASTLWTQSYNLIARANNLIEGVNNPISDGIPQDAKDRYAAEAYFCRASKYADLVNFYGAVPYVDKTLLVDEAVSMSRTPKDEIVPKIYADFDLAIAGLPQSYSGEQRFTKGAALAMKARFALFNEDFDVVEACTKQIMEMGIYSLNADWAQTFLQSTRNIPEYVFAFPRTYQFGVVWDDWVVKNLRTRSAAGNPGYGSYCPSWSLFAAFTCTDGLPIHESPLFDPANPFENRDPRCKMTIVEWGTRHLGVDYDPRPGADKVYNYLTNTEVPNNDNRVNTPYCSHNGLVWKKGIDETWLDNGDLIDRDYVVVRYADILLMYAEAKIEQNSIDQSVLDAINEVRARAYGVAKTDVSLYPAVTTTSQTELRKILRNERRVEFAMEGTRYTDILRWGIGENVLTQNVYGVAAEFSDAVTPANWFWVQTPTYDESKGIYDFSGIAANGTARILKELKWQKHYTLLPIPADEILQNPNLLPNNTGY